MRVVVCVTPGLPSKTVDTRASAPVKNRGARAEYPPASLLVPLGRHDEAALEVALRIRDGLGGTLTAISYGTSDGPATDSLRNALAYGADDALLVTDPEAAQRDSHGTAAVLAEALGRYGAPGLVVFGRYGSAWELGVTPQLVAGILRAPFVQGIDLRRSEDASTDSPVVAAISRSGTVRLRTPSLAAIERAFATDVELVAVSELGLDDGWATPRAGVVGSPVPAPVVVPEGSSAISDGVADLADRMVATLSLVNR